MATHLNHVPGTPDVSSSSVGLAPASQLSQKSKQKVGSGYPRAPIALVTFYRGQRDLSMVFTTLSNHATTVHLYGTFQHHLCVSQGPRRWIEQVLF